MYKIHVNLFQWVSISKRFQEIMPKNNGEKDKN